MNKKYILYAVVAVLVLGGSYALYYKKQYVRNAEMLKKTGGMEVVGEAVNYFEGANGYFVRPEAKGEYPGIVMIHENRGLRPEIRLMAEQLAKEGYLVLAVDLLGDIVETQEQARALTANYNQQTGIQNMSAAAEYLRSQGATSLGSIGWCFGGAQSLQFALARGTGKNGELPLGLDATVIYYGRLATTTVALAPIQWPVLGIFGGADQSISVQSVNQFEASLDALGVPNEVYIYPGVGHAFANPSGMNYAAEETKDAWVRTVNFLNKHLKGTE